GRALIALTVSERKTGTANARTGFIRVFVGGRDVRPVPGSDASGSTPRNAMPGQAPYRHSWPIIKAKGGSKVVTEAEYNEQLEAARWTECANCREKTLRRGPLQAANGDDYCCKLCARAGQRSQALLLKPQPKNGVNIDGWDL